MIARPGPRLFGWSTIVLMALTASPAIAQVGVRPWFVGGGSYGNGVVDNFLDQVSEFAQHEEQRSQKSPQNSPERPARETTPQTTPRPPAPQPSAPSAVKPAQSQPANRRGASSGSYSENPRKWGQVYLRMRQGAESYSLQERPRRLTSTEVDPVNGKIRWPQVFLDKKYDKLRGRIEQLFAQRASTSPTPEIATEIHDAIVEMVEMLRFDVDALPANDYVAGRKFLDSLDYLVLAPSAPKLPGR